MANFITIFRTILAIAVVSILFIKNAGVYWSAFVLTILVIWMDGLDGYVARKFNETSKFGAVLDIIGDRVVENVYWLAFCALGWIPFWVPVIVITRGIVTDGLRSMALSQGYTAFGNNTMMQSPIGKFIVASNFSRFSYAVFKAIAFALLIFINIPDFNYAFEGIINKFTYCCVYLSAIFCVVRGLPVILESKQFIKLEKQNNEIV